MRNNVTKNRSGASLAVNVAGNESAPLQLEFRDLVPLTPASERIREARRLLADLLIEDEEKGLLIGVVSDDLNRIMLELDSSAGLQQLSELWGLQDGGNAHRLGSEVSR